MELSWFQHRRKVVAREVSKTEISNILENIYIPRTVHISPTNETLIGVASNSTLDDQVCNV